MEDTIARKEHEEFAKRIEEENDRQNHRLSTLEENVKEIHSLTLSVEKMSVNMGNMLEVLKRQGNLIEKQGERLDAMEKEPAKDYKQVKMTVVSTVIGAIAGAIAAAILTLL